MDLFLEVDPNPNCDAVDGMMYQALEPPRRVRQIRITRAGQETWCWVTGVESPAAAGQPPRWVPAQVQKISDSGAGIAWCIIGGRWGLRFQHAAPAEAPVRPSGQPAASGAPGWDLADAAQWGEPYKIYGDLQDLQLEV